MKINSLSLKWFVKNLKKNIPFTFARYGDGEWLTILGFYGMHNSNGCTFTRSLSDDMRAVLKRQNNYHHAILKIARRERKVPYQGEWLPYGGPVIQQWLDDNNITLNWYNGDVLLEESLKGKLLPLIEQIRERRVLYVGNKRLRDLNMKGIGFFPYVAYIEPPPRDAHLAKTAILPQIFKTIRKYKIDFIGWSSGLAGKVFIDEVFMRFPEVIQIDFGSMFDGYFTPMDNVNPAGSRSYIRKGGYDWAALLQANTGQVSFESEEIKGEQNEG
jgi:hypothetical protein